MVQSWVVLACWRSRQALGVRLVYKGDGTPVRPVEKDLCPRGRGGEVFRGMEQFCYGDGRAGYVQPGKGDLKEAFLWLKGDTGWVGRNYLSEGIVKGQGVNSFKLEE